jgi:hypothetical protein
MGSQHDMAQAVESETYRCGIIVSDILLCGGVEEEGRHARRVPVTSKSVALFREASSVDVLQRG